MNLKSIKNVACLGTGTMGPGVAFLCAKAGYNVAFFGRSRASIERGFRSFDAAMAVHVEGGLMPAASREAVRARVRGVTSLEEAAAGADFVIESVIESLAVKQEVFRIMEKNVNPGAVLATDTSGLSPGLIASVLDRPELFIVTHFINPPHLIPAVEVVPSAKTLPEVQRLAVEWVRSLGNIPIEMTIEIPGFIINRLQFACLREALYMVEQGWAKPESVDAAMRYSLGRRYPVTGPLETADLGGLDTFSNVARYLYKELCSDREPSRLLLETADAGKLGAKSGQGLYQWPAAKFDEVRSARETQLVEWLKKDLTAKNS